MIFPLEGERGLRNARSIIRAEPGTIQDGYVLEACQFLILFGDAIDVRMAEAVRDAITERTVNEMNNRFATPIWHAWLFWAAAFGLCLTLLVAVS